ncbi:hypothetical protein PBF_22652 [Cytobacillus firmus DS1]|uniref:Uncharacterized protein n=1 Tax=Cytobacillus firmus DS1 TaxID=1307436 RepID=W7KZR0_CYTFI|nr:hypothetical protein PBF_22652 [Cytobacillus firmus DS1]
MASPCLIVNEMSLNWSALGQPGAVSDRGSGKRGFRVRTLPSFRQRQREKRIQSLNRTHLRTDRPKKEPAEVRTGNLQTEFPYRTTHFLL